MLDDLDKKLEKRGHSFCRYADDCNIYVSTQRSGERVLASITNYLETKLKLKLNHLKSAADRPSRRIFPATASRHVSTPGSACPNRRLKR